MQPFIFIYHAVAYIFSLPKTILSYSFKGVAFLFYHYLILNQKKMMIVKN